MSNFDKDLKQITRRHGIGSPDSAMFNLFYGMNQLGTGDIVPGNRDHQGFVFFTKPNMNLSADNIRKVGKLQYLLDTDPNSLATAIRCSLMPPRMSFDGCIKNGSERVGVRSSAVDDQLPFIPFLSTTLESLSGWPDEIVEWFISAEGSAKQVYGYVDSRAEYYGSFPLTATFIAKEGDPHYWFFNAYREYMTRVAVGEIVPWPESEAEYEIDYFTNMYVMLMDPTKKYIQKLACLGAGGAPDGISTGAAFNFSGESIFSQENARYSVPFTCFGALYNDPIIVENFNDIVRWFKPSMAMVQDSYYDRLVINGKRAAPTFTIAGYEVDYVNTSMVPGSDFLKRSYSGEAMVKIPDQLKFVLNWKGYPFINDKTSELEWWIDESVFRAYMGSEEVNEDE
jgi:hypothetical protein